MGIHSVGSSTFSRAVRDSERQPPDPPSPFPGPTPPMPVPAQRPVPLTLAMMLGASLVQRSIVSRSDLMLVTQMIQTGPDTVDPRTGELCPVRVLRLAVSFANEALVDFIRGLGPAPQPNEDSYRTALRGFITQINNGQVDRVVAHVNAHFMALAAENRFATAGLTDGRAPTPRA